MNTPIESIITRAKNTRHAQENVQSIWMWKEMTLAQWESEISNLRKIQDACSSARVVLNGKRDARDAAFQELHRRTMQFIPMARFHFRGDRLMLEAIGRLTSVGGKCSAIAQEARDLEKAWEEFGSDWAPTEENTFASFRAFRQQCTDLEGAVIEAQNALRSQSKMLKEKAAALNEANIAWYAVAIRIFPEGSGEGDLIRRSIPTRPTRSSSTSPVVPVDPPAAVPAVQAPQPQQPAAS